MSIVRQNLPQVLKSFEDYDVFVNTDLSGHDEKTIYYLRTEHDPSVGIFGQDASPILIQLKN